MSARAIAALSLALALSACRSANAFDHEVNASRAIRVEARNDEIEVEGVVVEPAGLASAMEAAHRERGDGGSRISAAVKLAFERREGEEAFAFEERARRRTEEVLDLLVAAGVRDLLVQPARRNRPESRP